MNEHIYMEHQQPKENLLAPREWDARLLLIHTCSQRNSGRDLLLPILYKSWMVLRGKTRVCHQRKPRPTESQTKKQPYNFTPSFPTSTTWSIPSYSGISKSYFSWISGLINLHNQYISPVSTSTSTPEIEKACQGNSPPTNKMSPPKELHQRFRRSQTN